MRPRKLSLIRTPTLVLLALLPISCGLLFFSSRIQAPARSATDSLLLPFQRAGAKVSSFLLAGARSAGAVFEREGRLRELEDQARRLEAQLAAEKQASQARAAKLQQLSLLLEKLHGAAPPAQLLASSNIIARSGVTAWNIAASASSLEHWCVVDRGSREGVLPQSPVTGSGCLAGKVASVGRRTSRVILVIDPAFRAGVQILSSGAGKETAQPLIQGLLMGAGHAGCRVEYVPRDAQVNVGDLVVTSGLDGQFPPGLLIGKVSRVRTRELYLQIDVSPSVDVGSLQSLFIQPPVLEDAAGTFEAR